MINKEELRRPKVIHKVGNRYKHKLNKQDYLLVYIYNVGSYLIYINNGINITLCCVKIKDMYNITDEEFRIITNDFPEHYEIINNDISTF